MLNSLMNEKELNVKVGDKVSVQGNEGIVTEVLHYCNKGETTAVRVHFTGDLAVYGQYQNGVYGLFTVIK